MSNPVDFVERSIKSNIENSIKNSKAKVAVALSSGVDSTLVLTLLKKTYPAIPVSTISVKFAESIDESKHAAKIAQKFDVDHHVLYIENYLAELPAAINIIKQPFWDLHWYHIVKKAKTLSKFLVSGDGGDELFGGYTFRYEKFLSLTKKNSSPLVKVKAYLQCHERDWVLDQKDLFGSRASFSWKEIHSKLLPYFDNSLHPLSQVFLADFNGKLLYNWIPLNTAFHRHFEVKPVTPILSKNMISFATHIPVNLKYDQKRNIGKLILRQILQKYSLEKMLIKKKQGFTVNTINLWKSHGYDLCSYYLSDARIIQDKWISKDWIHKHFRKNDLDIRYVNKFLGLLALEVWYRLFITKEMKPTITLA
ncbi:asparagine synthase-related protein [Candidatus Nitrosotenuis chungbukensis]|uniref:asparagine synthase-related protein n=1 Tax=Candidatus Nitrosotenuis chungbukensis TaxID=1353246 RepID=UPI000C7DD0C9|nr:asparagine synthase C-terminal domain-containing protein [Candidatus Nitrosotenuis chungbukensis]